MSPNQQALPSPCWRYSRKRQGKCRNSSNSSTSSQTESEILRYVPSLSNPLVEGNSTWQFSLSVHCCSARCGANNWDLFVMFQQHSNLHTSIGNSVWGSLNTNPSNQWASDLVSSIWSNADTKNSNMGFWDDAVKEVGPRNSTNKNKSNASLR